MGNDPPFKNNNIDQAKAHNHPIQIFIVKNWSKPIINWVLLQLAGYKKLNIIVPIPIYTTWENDIQNENNEF